MSALPVPGLATTEVQDVQEVNVAGCTPDEFRSAMRQLAAAVSIVAAGRPGQRNGLTATAVMSLTAEPPRLVVAVNKDASAYHLLVGEAGFCVNVLAHSQLPVGMRFSGLIKGEERFQQGDWETLATGAPALRGALANFDCRLARVVDCGTHVLLIGDVMVARCCAGEEPLVYVDGQWASLPRPQMSRA